MSYTSQSNRDYGAVVNLAGQTVSNPGNSTQVGVFNHLMCQLVWTNNSGTTPTLDVKAQTTLDNGTTWTDVTNGAFTQKTTGNGNQLLELNGGFGQYIRFFYTLGGTSPNYDIKVYVFGRGNK